MAAIGMLLLWISYTLIFYGFILFRGYQITLLDLVVPGRWTGGWPPASSFDSGGGPSLADQNAAAGSVGSGAASVGNAVGKALIPLKPGTGRRRAGG